MNCKFCSALFQEFLEKSLSEELISELDGHMQICEKCRRSLRTYLLTIILSRKLNPPCSISTEKVDHLKQVLMERFFPKRIA